MDVLSSNHSDSGLAMDVIASNQQALLPSMAELIKRLHEDRDLENDLAMAGMTKMTLRKPVARTEEQPKLVRMRAGDAVKLPRSTSSPSSARAPARLRQPRLFDDLRPISDHAAACDS
jgi:hypothetical protein